MSSAGYTYSLTTFIIIILEIVSIDSHVFFIYRFLTSKSGKLYLHTDIRIIVSRKSDLDTATAHSAILKSITDPTKSDESSDRKPVSRVYGGCDTATESSVDTKKENDFELAIDNQNGLCYELRSFTYGPENPKYSPR